MPLTDVCTYVVCLFFFNIKFIIARLLLCQTALARLLLCQTAVFLGLYAPRLPIFLCFCQTAAVWEIGQSGNLKRVVGYLTRRLRVKKHRFGSAIAEIARASDTVAKV